ncbi:MAG: elongation factor G-like protein EF-G2 [Mycobacteriales bacterium]
MSVGGTITGSEAAAAPAAAADAPGKVRNVAVVGHTGAGKTTLVEVLLAATGTISRAGTVEDGTTVSDADPAEHKQQRSVALSVAPIEQDGVTVNLLDTPGYADFTGELRAGLRAADCALFVVSAADGVDATTVTLWGECAESGTPRALVITRLDHQRADLDATMATCQGAFGDNVLPLYAPVRDGSGALTGLVGLLSQTASDYTDGYPPRPRTPDADELAALQAQRNALIEGIIGESEDESLMDRYLAGESIDLDTLITDLEAAVASGTFYPVIPVCAQTAIGLAELLEVLTRAFPAPDEHPFPDVTTIDGDPVVDLSCDPNGPLVAEVVRTSVDPYVGRISLVRVFSGTLRTDLPVHVAGHGLADRGHADHDDDGRAGHLHAPLGVTLRPIDACAAGGICAVTKLPTAATGDTISAKDSPLLVAPWQLPEPLLPIAIEAHSRSDEDALARGLARLIAGDPSLRLERNDETHQLVLWCMGEAHADVILDRLREQGAALDTVPVVTAYRETFAQPAAGHGRHVKQSGGHGQYAVCDIQVEPLEAGAGFEFVDKIVGGAIPSAFVASVEKGVRAQMGRGISAGRPVIDIRVTLRDGKTHSVDSSDAAFQQAGGLALREAAAAAGTVVLEPVHQVAVTVADQYIGAVLSNLSSRRGHVTGTEPVGGERTRVSAEVPESELLRYAVELRSLTGGSGRFSRKYVRHQPIRPG